MGNNHPNWRTHIFQRGGPTTNQSCIPCMRSYRRWYRTRNLRNQSQTHEVSRWNWGSWHGTSGAVAFMLVFLHVGCVLHPFKDLSYLFWQEMSSVSSRNSEFQDQKWRRSRMFFLASMQSFQQQSHILHLFASFLEATYIHISGTYGYIRI